MYLGPLNFGFINTQLFLQQNTINPMNICGGYRLLTLLMAFLQIIYVIFLMLTFASLRQLLGHTALYASLFLGHLFVAVYPQHASWYGLWWWMFSWPQVILLICLIVAMMVVSLFRCIVRIAYIIMRAVFHIDFVDADEEVLSMVDIAGMILDLLGPNL